MKSLSKKQFFIAFILGTVLLYSIMGLYADISSLQAQLNAFIPMAFVLLIILTLIGYGIRFLKWTYMTNQIGIPLTLKENFFVFFSGFAMLITPGKIGELWRSWLIKDLHQTPVSRTIPVVVLDRLTDVMSLLILSAMGLFVSGGTLFLLFCILLFFSLMLFIKTGCMRKIIHWVISSRMGSRLDTLPLLDETLQELTSLKFLTGIIFINTIAWLCEGIGLYVIVSGFQMSLPVLDGIYIFSLSSLLGGISMIPGGLGVAEVSMTGLLQASGLPADGAVASTLLLRLGSFWFGIFFGICVYISMKRQFSQYQRNHNEKDIST